MSAIHSKAARKQVGPTVRKVIGNVTVTNHLYIVTAIVIISNTDLAACVCQCAKFDKFLPARSHFYSRRPERFVRIATFPSATFGPLFAFHCPLFFTKNNNLGWKSSRFATRDVFENGNDDFGVEASWAIHCAHWSSGFMVLNASISRVLGQRPTFYCPLFVLCFVFYGKQEIRRRQFPAIDVWFSRCCRVDR